MEALVQSQANVYKFNGRNGEIRLIRRKSGRKDNAVLDHPWYPGMVNGKGSYCVATSKFYDDLPNHVVGAGDSTPGGSYVTSVIHWIEKQKNFSFEFGWSPGAFSPVLAEGVFVQGVPNRLTVVNAKRGEWKDYFSERRGFTHFAMPFPWQTK